MKREEILALCASNPEVIAYIESLESQIKELTIRLGDTFKEVSIKLD